MSTASSPNRTTVAYMHSLKDFQNELVDVAEQFRLLHTRSLISVQQYQPAYELVRKHVPEGARVLDWGAGNGHFSYFLMRFNYATSGVGFDDMPQVCGAPGVGPYDYRRASDPVRIPFEDQSLDAVLSIGVLEHVRETGGNETASLREVRRILKPDGIFICAHLPNRLSWIEMLARGLSRSSHRFTYTQAEIIHLTRSAGLRLVDIGRYGALPRNIWSTESLRKIGSWAPAVGAYAFTDSVLSFICPPLCQNYWFVAGPATV